MITTNYNCNTVKGQNQQDFIDIAVTDSAYQSVSSLILFRTLKLFSLRLEMVNKKWH